MHVMTLNLTRFAMFYFRRILILFTTIVFIKELTWHQGVEALLTIA
jgi:hypothetical protein